MKNIAIIPARAGSKGLKDKNIKEILGKPLLSYTIEAAKLSEKFEIVHLSTDNNLYAEIGKNCGADVPFLRTETLAGDSTSSWEVVKYVLEQYEKIGYTFETVALLQPTSPLRNEIDIKRAYDIYINNRANSVMSVCEMEHTPLWSNTLPENHSLKNFILPENDIRRQDLPVYYRQNGAIYIESVDLIMNDGNLYGDRSYAYIMDSKHSIDIDTELDFIIAEAIMGLAIK